MRPAFAGCHVPVDQHRLTARQRGKPGAGIMLQQEEVSTMNITFGVALICIAIAMIWFGRPSDGVSLPWFKKAWIIGQLYVMTAMVLFVMGGAAIIANI